MIEERIDNSRISLRDYIDTRFTALNERLDATDDEITRRFNAEQQATSLARQAMERRLDGMNEFRDSLRDQSEAFVNKNECRLRHTASDEELQRHEDKIEKLQLNEATLAGKASKGAAFFAASLACVGVAISIVGIIMAIVH